MRRGPGIPGPRNYKTRLYRWFPPCRISRGYSKGMAAGHTKHSLPVTLVVVDDLEAAPPCPTEARRPATWTQIRSRKTRGAQRMRGKVRPVRSRWKPRVAPKASVPDLTFAERINLNERVSLRRASEILSSPQSCWTGRHAPRRPCPTARSGAAAFPISKRGRRPRPLMRRNRRHGAGSCGKSRTVIARAAFSLPAARGRI
jgi:hypothetical protein